MGLSDAVIAYCPKCKSELKFQSKAGDCDLKRYHIRSVPPEIALDLHGEYGDTVMCCDIEWKLGQTTIPGRVSMYIIQVADDGEIEEWD